MREAQPKDPIGVSKAMPVGTINVCLEARRLEVLSWCVLCDVPGKEEEHFSTIWYLASQLNPNIHTYTNRLLRL